MIKKYRVTITNKNTGESSQVDITIGNMGKAVPQKILYEALSQMINTEESEFSEDDIKEVVSIVSIPIEPYCPN